MAALTRHVRCSVELDPVGFAAAPRPQLPASATDEERAAALLYSPCAVLQYMIRKACCVGQLVWLLLGLAHTALS